MNAHAGWAAERQFAPATASPAQARDFVERPLIQHGLVHLVGDIRLVVSELVTNAVVHAGTSIRVRIEELPSWVKLTVYDRSVDLPVLRLSTRISDDTESGRGLWIVDACSSEWGTDLTDGEGKAIWARWPCGQPSREPAPTGVRSATEASHRDLRDHPSELARRSVLIPRGKMGCSSLQGSGSRQLPRPGPRRLLPSAFKARLVMGGSSVMTTLPWFTVNDGAVVAGDREVQASTS
jgi:hypothetical protein